MHRASIQPTILGLSAYYHEAAAALLVGGRVVAAGAEERYSRRKHDAALPVRAVVDLLRRAGLTVADLDAVAYYERPEAKVERQRATGRGGESDPGRPAREIRERLGIEAPLLMFDHHLSHAASAYYFGPFDEAALLTVDGVGEWATTAYGVGRGDGVELVETVDFPHSLGLFYAALTAFLGFRVNGGEGKVMGLAAYGTPRFAAALGALVRHGSGGQFRLDPRYFDFVRGPAMYSGALRDLLGGPPRRPEEPITSFHQDVAASLQVVLEERLLAAARYLHRRFPSHHLGMAGGVALNCVANGRLLREGPFDRLFLQPAAGDAGGALGAAALAHVELTGSRPEPLGGMALGPAFSDEEVAALLGAAGLPAGDYCGDEAALLDEVVTRLARGEVVGWFQGGMEFGPRALGGRSILADPRRPGMRDRLNQEIKRREPFRPFAPSVLEAHAAAHFDLEVPSPYMLLACRVRSPLDLPAVTHVDGTARPQTVGPEAPTRFRALLELFFRRTGCPMLVNTSLNVRGEPIARSPLDALRTLSSARLDALVLESHLIARAALPPGWDAHLAPPPPEEAGGALYTFV